MLQFSLFKKIAIIGVCVAGIILVTPNFFYNKVEKHNDALVLLDKGEALTAEQQADYDAWPEWAPNNIVNLGLDLRGGAHLLVEVNVADVYKTRLDAMWPVLRTALREGDDRDVIGSVVQAESADDELRIEIGNPENMTRAVEIANGLTRPVVSLTGAGSRDFEVSTENNQLVLRLSEAEKIATDDRTMLQSLEIIRRRVDEAGTREPSIQRQGSDRILVQVPGIGSAEELLELIGKTAKLDFMHVVSRTSNADARPGIGNVIFPSIDEPGVYYIVEESAVVGGDDLDDAKLGFDQRGQPAVEFRFNPSGGRKFGEYTAANVNNPFAIVLDNEVISAPRIDQPIPGGSGIITGNFSVETATQLAILLRAGALPAEITPLEKRTVGPELGQDSIEAGQLATTVAFAAVMIFMFLSYGLFGLFANVALILNVAMIFTMLSLLGATLTMPGIAGIALTIGMAVDANVLIFERIREELRAGRGPIRAVELGYEKALSAIIDANITTLIAAVILYALGSGPVRGFAITLGLGIVTSVFTAIWVTRLMVAIWLNARKPKTIEV